MVESVMKMKNTVKRFIAGFKFEYAGYIFLLFGLIRLILYALHPPSIYTDPYALHYFYHYRNVGVLYILIGSSILVYGRF